MKASVFAGSLLSGLVLMASPLAAQRVSADVAVRGGPIAGHVVVGDGYSTYRRRPVIHYHAAPRVVVVERIHRRHHVRHWKRHGFRPVTVYLVNGRYYHRWDGHPRGVRQVVVYQRDGRYYEVCDRDHRHDHRHYDWDD